MPLTKATQNVVEGIVSTGSTGVSAGSFIVGQQYKITSLGTTTQSQWNTIAGTTGQTYVVGSLFTSATAGASSGNGAAAVARTLANRFADVVNVLDFGADPTGAINSRQPIQDALDSGAGTIFFPDGVYSVFVMKRFNGNTDLSLRPKSNQTIIFSGNAVIQVQTNPDDYYAVFTVGNDENPSPMNVDNLTFIGGTLIGDRLTHTGGGEAGIGILIRPGATNITVKNMTVKNFWGDGFLVGGISLFDPNDEPKNIVFENCVSINNRRNNMSIVRSDGVLVQGGLYENANGTAPEAGIDVETDPSRTPNKNVKINNVTITKNKGAGIQIYLADNVIVSNCIIADNDISGIKVVNLSKNVNINGCLIDGNNTDGVTVEYNAAGGVIENVIISGNQIKNNNQNGVKVYGASRRTLISGNIISFNGRHGVLADGSATYKAEYITVLGNTMIANSQEVNNTYDHVNFTANTAVTHSILDNNMIRGNSESPTSRGTRYGIQVLNSSLATMIIANNQMINSGNTEEINGVAANIVNNTGYVTDTSALSSVFDASTTGVRTITYAHGLPYIPTKQSVSGVLEDVDGDNISGTVVVKTTDATNVVFIVNILVAATIGLKRARIGVKINRARS
jgi:hypothetical protein